MNTALNASANRRLQLQTLHRIVRFLAAAVAPRTLEQAAAVAAGGGSGVDLVHAVSNPSPRSQATLSSASVASGVWV